MKISVIGAGVSGLSAAILLARDGHEVTVYDKNSTPGGKISQIKDKGYRFDTGPSLFTLPQLAEKLTFFSYTSLDNSCRYFYQDGTRFNFYNTRDQLKKELEKNDIHEFENIGKRFAQAAELYEMTADFFIFSPFGKISSFMDKKNGKLLFNLHKLGFHKSMHKANKSSFSNKKIVQLFDRYATYNGSSPYRAPSTLNMIAHLEHNLGAFFPKGGIYTIADSLFHTAQNLGVSFKFNSFVNNITTDKTGKSVKGFECNGVFEECELLVSAADIKYLTQNCFKKDTIYPPAKRVVKNEPSSSALIFYWGVKGSFEEMQLHNILFSGDYKEEFRHLFTTGDIHEDPTVYIFISKKAVPTDAPEGCENWFVMVNAPSNNGQDWDSIVRQTRANIIKKIDTTLSTDIESKIESEHIATPLTIEKDTLSSGGALYGNSSNSLFSAFLRHPNKTRHLKNMWFAGGSVHPGGGIPLCIASSMIVSEDIKNHVNKRSKL
jgi:phytoene desaturase